MNSIKSIAKIKLLIWLISSFVIISKADLELTVKDTSHTKQNVSVLIDTAFTETSCIFPFQYNNTWYNRCLKSSEDSTYWCSLDQVYSQRKATCDQECPLLALQLTPSHSSCVKANSNALSIHPNETVITNILELHNNIRGNVSDPNATDMVKVTWDIGLAMTAQSWADNCVFNHDCFNCRALVNNESVLIGQNAYASFGAPFDQTFWPNVVQNWNSESKNFKYGIGSKTGNFGDVGHYTQIIYSQTVKIGCGATNCGSDTIYAFCNYAVGQGNWETPYKSGQSCSSCPGNCVNNLCQCNLICQNGGNIDLDKCKCSCPSGLSGTVCEIKS